MYVQRFTVSLTSDSDGAATGYTPNLTGAIHQIAYTKTDFSDGVDFTITTEDTGITVWIQNDVNASVTVCPRQATHSTAGVASLYAAAGTAVQTPIVVDNERIKIVVASAGAAHTGTFDIWIA